MICWSSSDTLKGNEVRLLVLTNNPKRASFRQRIAVHLETLRQHGIESEVAVFPPGAAARKRLFKLASDFDAVFLQKRRLNLFDARVLRRYARQIIYDFDDAVMYSPSDPERKSRSHAWPFRRTVKLADLVIAGNAYLAEHAGRFNSNVSVLPTGLNTKAYSPGTKPQEDGKIRLVWIGSKSTLKYLAGIRDALEQTGRLHDNVVLRIICDDFFDLEAMAVEKCLWARKTQYQDLAGSDIGLAPLPEDPFTRGKCGFKILQYAAAGLPTVASPVGVNAQYVQGGVTGLLASETDEWVECLCKLVADRQKRQQMGANAGEFVRPFDLAAIGGQLAELILACGADLKS